MTLPERFNLKTITLVSLALMAVVMLWVSKDFGISGDEVTQATYGEKVLAYYTSGGADKSSLTFKNVYFYGGLYDMTCAALNKVLPFDPYDTRHAINALMGALTIAAAAWLARRYGGWGAALATAWFLFLSPRFFGESMNNPKDIPFALSMTLGVIVINRLVRSFPAPRWKDLLLVALVVGFAVSIRVGGLLLIPYLVVAAGLEYLLSWRKTHGLTHPQLLRFVGLAALASAVGYGLGLVFWPYALQDPISNPFKALGEMSQFSTGIRMLYDDRMIMSSSVPWYYIPKWIYITSPLVVLALFTASPLLLALDRSQKRGPFLFLFFAAFFPAAYIIYKHSPLYDGWRHLLFVYPPMTVLASLMLVWLIRAAKQPALKATLVGATALLLIAMPLRWMIVNHPHQIVYFNELQGGTAGAYGYYETDYYMNSMKPAVKKLDALVGLRSTKDSLIIATNCIEPVIHYLQRLNPRLKPIYIRYRERHQSKWDYALLYSRFMDKELLQNGHFPPDGTIATISADGAPLAAILKGDPEHLAFQASEALKAQNFAGAATLYQQALVKTPNDETIFLPYCIALANTGRVDEAIAVAQKATTYTPASIETFQLLSQLYTAKGNAAAAAEANARAQAIIYEQQEDAAE